MKDAQSYSMRLRQTTYRKRKEISAPPPERLPQKLNIEKVKRTASDDIPYTNQWHITDHSLSHIGRLSPRYEG